MGKSSKDREVTNEPEVIEQTPTPAVSLTTDPQAATAVSESELMARDIKEGRLSGFVGGGTVLTGETTFESMLRIDGHLKGRVSSEDGTLIIGSTGRVDADISVSEAIINGAVNGDVVTYDKLTLGRAATVVGNIQSPRLIIEDGATLEGNCSMLQSIEAVEEQIEETRQAQLVAEQEQLAVQQEQEAYESVNETTDEVEESLESETSEYGSISDTDSDDEDELEETADAAVN